MNRTGNTTACPQAWAVMAWHQRKSSTSPKNFFGAFLMHSLRRYWTVHQQIKWCFMYISLFCKLMYNGNIFRIYVKDKPIYIIFQFWNFCFCPSPEPRPELHTEACSNRLLYTENHWDIQACWLLSVTDLFTQRLSAWPKVKWIMNHFIYKYSYHVCLQGVYALTQPLPLLTIHSMEQHSCALLTIPLLP